MAKKKRKYPNVAKAHQQSHTSGESLTTQNVRRERKAVSESSLAARNQALKEAQEKSIDEVLKAKRELDAANVDVEESERRLRDIGFSQEQIYLATGHKSDQRITGHAKTAEEALAAEQDLAIPVKTHLDGDPKPRPDELTEWNELRIKKGMDKMTAIILVPDEAQTGNPFPGYTHYGWNIYQRTEAGKTSEIMCEPEETNISIIDDKTAAEYMPEHQKFLNTAVRDKMEEHVDDALHSDYLRDKLAEDNLELKTEDDYVWVEPTREAQEAEFVRRFDRAVALAQDADDDPTPEKYFALLGYYEQFAHWLENDVKLSGSAEHILKIKGLNKLLIDRIDDRLGALKNKERTEEEEGEYRGWQRLHEAIHKPQMMEPPPPVPHSTYKMGWEGAVDLQDEMIRFWYTPLGHAYGEAFGKTMLNAAKTSTEELLRKPGANDLLWAKNIPNIQRAALQSANPMWISPDMQKLIQAAAMHPTFKTEPLRREDVYPNMYGFALFPEPFYILDESNRWLAFRGVSWTPYGKDGRIAYEAAHDTHIHPEDAGGLLVTGYTHRNDPDDIPFMSEMGPEENLRFRKSDIPIMTLCYITPWSFDKGVPIDLNGSGLKDFCKIVQTLWRFARQKVAAPTATRLPRPARRRAERTGLQSDVIVVKLRQRKHKKEADGEEGKAYELSVRFIVGSATGGFWRDQWYPKEKIHRQIWIMPFWKGPEDAPELIKPLRAYELTR